MNPRALAAVAALFSTALPGPLLAQELQDDMSYPRVTHCAALNILLGQVLGLGPDKDRAEVKAQSETYIAQAAALTLVAAVIDQKDPQQVQAEVFAKSEALTQSLSDDGAAEALLQRDFGTCTEMGKAAYDAVQAAEKS